ncbi:MAG: hypothetical protein WED00_05620 [Aquisalimonadaceae bacterium]
MHRIDSPGNADNLFRDRNPEAGIPGTIVWSKWLNAVQEEIAGLLAAREVDLDEEDNNQLASLFSLAAFLPVQNNGVGPLLRADGDGSQLTGIESSQLSVVRDGAIGDGVANDTAACQSTLDKAPGVVLFPAPGVYMVDRLFPKSNTTVVIEPGAMVKFRPQAPTSHDWGGVFSVFGTELEPKENVFIIGGGVVDGSKGDHDFSDPESSELNVECIDIEWAINCHVVAVTCINAEGDGIDFDHATDCTATRTRSVDCDGWGIHFSNGCRRCRGVLAVAVRCGVAHNRGGFDTHQGGSDQAEDCGYVGCTTEDCRRGWLLGGPRSWINGGSDLGGGVSTNCIRITGDRCSVNAFIGRGSTLAGISITGNLNAVSGCNLRAESEAVAITGNNNTVTGNVLERITAGDLLTDIGTGNIDANNIKQND